MGKRLLKYGLYGAAGLWMFALGVMVGRGTSPVTFDTRGFQARLGAIVQGDETQGKTESQVDLGFYDALNNPVRHEVKGRAQKNQEILPRSEPLVTVEETKTDAAADEVPVKLSKKHASLNRDRVGQLKEKNKALKSQPPVKTVKSAKKVSKEKKPVKARPMAKPVAPAPDESDKYTIQVAAYKAFKDAVSQMATLEKKGIKAYRVKGERNGVTWYRVRTGGFPDFKTAAQRLEELKQAKVNGMIIKKE